jgi:hypothetical protein
VGESKDLGAVGWNRELIPLKRGVGIFVGAMGCNREPIPLKRGVGVIVGAVGWNRVPRPDTPHTRGRRHYRGRRLEINN